VCLVWASNPLVGDSIDLDRYLEMGHVAIGFGREPIGGIDEEFFRSTGVQRRVEVVATTFNLLPQLLVGTTRIATVPGRLARWYARCLPLRVTPPPVEFPVLTQLMQWHRSRSGDAGTVWLRGALGDCVAAATV
jgi:DNA-binding transcriptional LysR family regulator